MWTANTSSKMGSQPPRYARPVRPSSRESGGGMPRWLSRVCSLLRGTARQVDWEPLVHSRVSAGDKAQED
jgi:hypothetical protein